MNKRPLKKLEQEIIDALKEGETATPHLHSLRPDDSEIRKRIRELRSRGLIRLTKEEKLSRGPGRPAKHYELTDKYREIYE